MTGDARLIRPPRRYAVVAALRRYDPNIDVRWSWQRGMWALTVAVDPRFAHLIPAPVKVVRDGPKMPWREERLPERSEAAVSYRTKTMPIGYVATLSSDLLRQVAETDTQRKGRVARQLAKMKEAVERDRMRLAQNRWREARKFMLWHSSRNPMSTWV